MALALKGLTRARRGGLLLVGVISLWLLAASPAGAVQTSMYDNVGKCPVGSAEMNDPAATGVACVSSLVRGGFMRVGNFQVALNSPLHLQFAFATYEDPESELETELRIVKGSTSFDGDPFVIPNPFLAQMQPPPATPPATPPAKKKKKAKKKKQGKKKHGKHKKHDKHKKKKKKKKKKKAKKRAPVIPAPAAPQPDPFVRALLEPAGELKNLNLSAGVGGEGGPIFELPVKMHLQATGLGPSCYIGTDADPIVLAPTPSKEPTGFKFGADPNGFKVEGMAIEGSALKDETFAVPGASGCGPIDPATDTYSLNNEVNALIGLPAISGGSVAVLDNVLLELVAAFNDGSLPEGGDELAAAFAAAK